MVKVEPDTHNGLEKSSAADTFQVRSVSIERFVRRQGRLDEALISQIAKGLGRVLEIEK